MNRWKHLCCRIIHFAWGVMTGLMTVVNMLLSAFMFSIFILYELDEEREIRDSAYQEFAEFAFGLLTSAIILLMYS